MSLFEGGGRGGVPEVFNRKIPNAVRFGALPSTAVFKWGCYFLFTSPFCWSFPLCPFPAPKHPIQFSLRYIITTITPLYFSAIFVVVRYFMMMRRTITSLIPWQRFFAVENKQDFSPLNWHQIQSWQNKWTSKWGGWVLLVLLLLVDVTGWAKKKSWAKKETGCTCGGRGSLLLSHACLKESFVIIRIMMLIIIMIRQWLIKWEDKKQYLRAALGVILVAGSHSRHRRMKSVNRGSSHPKISILWISITNICCEQGVLAHSNLHKM